MTDPTQTLPRLHALPDVAKQVGVPLRALRERARRREFDHVLIGRERYLTDEQLDGFIASTTVTAQTAESQRDADLAKTRERVGRKRGQRRPAA